VGVAAHRDQLQGLRQNAPVAADRVDAHQVRAIGGAEEEAPFRSSEMYGKLSARGAVDRGFSAPEPGSIEIDVHRIRLGARGRVEQTPVRAHRHRHHHFRRLRAREGLERPIGLHAVHADLAVLGVRDVDECSARARGACQCRHGDDPLGEG